MVERKQLIAAHEQISLRRQCELLSVNRSGLYYVKAQESPYNLELMKLLDEQYTRTPFYGVARMTAHLQRLGHQVNEKRIRRLLRLMGIYTVYPKPRTSLSCKENAVYPYLLKEVVIDAPNQVWSCDITYIRLLEGFVYLVAIIDWYSRFVLSFRLSQSLETSFCLKAVKQALEKHKPQIFNTDQGCQFTSADFTQLLLENGIKISMDGKGRCFDNIFVERLWRSVKYEEVYLNSYSDIKQANHNLAKYFNFYNYDRPHQALNYNTPFEIFNKTG
jgi:Transposase and inactivated derivatives